MSKKNLFKTKTIFSGGKPFLKRLSLYLSKGSIKLHIIINDDMDEHHSHPWDFESVIIFGGYHEEILNEDKTIDKKTFRIGDVNQKRHYQKHKTKLFRFLGFKIPAITIGKYSDKLELCSFCKELGYCKLNAVKVFNELNQNKK